MRKCPHWESLLFCENCQLNDWTLETQGEFKRNNSEWDAVYKWSAPKHASSLGLTAVVNTVLP